MIEEEKKEDNNGEIKEKRTRNKKTKEERYKTEREELMREIEEKMGLTEEKRGKMLYELEEDEELKEWLREKIEEIKKIYKWNQWAYFKNKEEDRDEIGLLRSMFKSEKYGIVSKREYKERDNIKKKYTCLYFIKDLNMDEILKRN